MIRWKLALSATAIWFAFLGTAVVCGAARESLLTPRTGPHIAHVVGSLVVIALFSIIIFFYVGAIQASKVSLIRIGLYWLLLTVAFEFFFGRYVMGRPWEVLLADYNLLRGRLWVLVLATVLFGPVFAGVKHNKTISRLIILQVFGVLLGTIVALFNIESIVGSGPILSLTGMVIVLMSYRANRPFGFYFGLATPTVAVVCFALICGLEWSPGKAYRPISSLLVIFALLHIPAGIRAFREAQNSQRTNQRRPVQFSIATLLWITLAVALFLGISRIANQQGIAIATLAAYSTLAGYGVRQFHKECISAAQPESVTSGGRSREAGECLAQRTAGSERRLPSD